MKKIFLIFQLVVTTFVLKGQPVPSSCNAHDSIIAKYINDADFLTLSKFYRRDIPLKDSINIPKTHSDTVLNALVAVYNAKNVPSHDTVIDLYKIHICSAEGLKYIDIQADPNLSWMQQLRAGIIPTGNITLDSLLSIYQMNIDGYFDFGGVFTYNVVTFKTKRNYNPLPLSILFKNVPGIWDSWPSGGCFWDVTGIKDSIFPDHVELIYSINWGDCPSGCIDHRHWKFNVYFDCSVVFVNSYGSILPLHYGLLNNDPWKFSIYPIPFNDQIEIENEREKEELSFNITNLLGQQILVGQTKNNRIENLGDLSPGLYILNFISNQKQFTYKIVKK